ncbi:MAG: hypothetical protein VXZ59_06115 [Cyanobacteriota bacterium]|nr:hypothetical protein [Cyanobacteriota bacterium]
MSTVARPRARNHHGRIAAGLLIGLSCFTAVVVGGVFIGQSFSDMLLVTDLLATQEIDPFIETEMG